MIQVNSSVELLSLVTLLRWVNSITSIKHGRDPGSL